MAVAKFWFPIEVRSSPACGNYFMLKTKIAGAMLYLLAMLAYADAGVNPAVVTLRDLLRPVQSMRANFQQQLYSADNYLVQDSRGSMQIATPGKLRWLMNTPMEQWVISDGETLWLYDPDLEQVIIRPFSADVAATPALLLAGSVEELADNYQVSTQSLGKDQTFTLKPSKGQTLYDYLTFDFNGTMPVGITIVDALGQRTVITFTDIVLNEHIDPALFSFQVPPGIDIIRDD